MQWVATSVSIGTLLLLTQCLERSHLFEETANQPALLPLHECPKQSLRFDPSFVSAMQLASSILILILAECSEPPRQVITLDKVSMHGLKTVLW
jgi:hypothetical protein